VFLALCCFFGLAPCWFALHDGNGDIMLRLRTFSFSCLLTDGKGDGGYGPTGSSGT